MVIELQKPGFLRIKLTRRREAIDCDKSIVGCTEGSAFAIICQNSILGGQIFDIPWKLQSIFVKFLIAHNTHIPLQDAASHPKLLLKSQGSQSVNKLSKSHFTH